MIALGEERGERRNREIADVAITSKKATQNAFPPSLDGKKGVAPAGSNRASTSAIKGEVFFSIRCLLSDGGAADGNAYDDRRVAATDDLEGDGRCRDGSQTNKQTNDNNIDIVRHRTRRRKWSFFVRSESKLLQWKCHFGAIVDLLPPTNSPDDDDDDDFGDVDDKDDDGDDDGSEDDSSSSASFTPFSKRRNFCCRCCRRSS